MHMGQNVLAETELRVLAAIPNQIVSPANNSPIIGIFQDSLLGSYRFTRQEMVLDAREAMNLLMSFNRVDPTTLFQNDKKRVTNFDVLSQIMPPMTLKYKTDLWDSDNGEDPAISNNILEIRNGQYFRGQLEKKSLGGGTRGILHRICNDYGNRVASDFIDDLQNIITEYMKRSSYSVGVSDLMSNKETTQRIGDIISRKKTEVGELIQKVHTGIFENNTSRSNQVEFELQVNNILNDATKDCDKVSRSSLNPNNRFLMIVNSGSKGSLINISHMISCLGQVNVDAKRVSYGFDSRSLPHFSKFDDSPGARGFIENSYINGLTAHELFFHAMGGRIGLIDTAVKSVSWETPIVIVENGVAKYTEIGRWIDDIIDGADPTSVQHFDEQNMELIDNLQRIWIPTTNQFGTVTWGEITAVTRHDPGDMLYKIKTLGGREVIVTASKSLLVYNHDLSIFEEKYTADIKIGDSLPVTQDLGNSEISLSAVNLSDYLPKTEFVYGTDFYKAIKIMAESMDGKSKIPKNWWNSNNGTSFVLPYSKKSSLQRVYVRSNIDNIVEGCVYPYHGQRSIATIPENFLLNFDNGVFVGLFLADGHSSGDHISITKNNPDIQNFVKDWFTSYNIHFNEKTSRNEYGSSTTITGHSSVISKFFNAFVGSGAANKHVPSEAFISNVDFVKGLINGFISGDGTVSSNSIEACSCSKRLIEGIGMLCSRIGVFVKFFTSQLQTNNFGTVDILPSYRLTIRGKWGALFASQVTLLHAEKQRKIESIVWKENYSKFKCQNNVVLDPVVSIDPIDPKSDARFNKMYDLTIPSTLNFGLANGLQVRDTSQTGYIQRRLIKGLEDLKVEYDMTVRNNKGKIIQYAYGDDCFDPMKTESQVFSLVTMSTEDIYMHYDFLGLPGQDAESSTSIAQIYTKSAQTEFRKQSEATRNACAKWIDEMMSLRDELVRNVFSNTDNNKVVFPVAFQHIINNVQGNLGLLSTSLVDFTPMDAFGLLDEYMAKLRAMHHVPVSRLFYAMYYFYLCPRDLLQVRRFHRQGFILLLETVVMKYKQAIIHPGEMVGVVSGQSIGEPTTQMTLNSFVYETEILVRDKTGKITCVQIGDFAKDGIHTSPKKEYYEKKDTTYAELLDYYEVPSCTEDGKTVWKRIEAVTKHPVINEDGTNTMIKVTTKGNREIIATKAKSFLQLIDGKIQAINGSELVVGDYLPVSKITHGISVFHGFLQENQIPTLPSCTHVPNKINGVVVSEDRADRYDDIEFDPIVSILEVPNTTNYAYDLTVEDTRNFDCMHGMCLNDTFHNSGVASKSNVTRGVPRLEEILRLTKNPKNPSLTVHLKPMDEANVEKAKQFATMMEHTTLKDLVKTVQITFDPNDQATLIAEDRELLRKYYAFATMFQECNGGTNDTDIVLSTETKSKWIIRMEMNTPTMLDKNITMDDVHYAIQMSKYGASKDLHCIYSDYNEDKLVFRLRVDSILTAKDKKRKSMGATDSADQSDEIYFLKKFQDEMLEQIVLRGIPGIKNVIPRKLMNRVEKTDGKYGNKDTWVLDTTGTNLMDSLALDFIDTTRTYSNDIREMFDVLGIEAARQSIFNEMSEVIEFSGAYVNYHPLSLLCDRMTCNGNMVAIFRTGLFSDNIGPVAKATFEVNTEVLLDASRYGELDNMRGVSANVMCGQPGYYGTNMFQLVLDMDKLTENTSRVKDSMGTYGNDDDIGDGLNILVEQDEVDVEKALYGPTKEMQLQRQNQQNIIVQQTMPFETRDSHNMDFCVGDDDNYDVGF